MLPLLSRLVSIVLLSPELGGGRRRGYGYDRRRRRGRVGRTRRGRRVTVSGCCLPIPLALGLTLALGARAAVRR